MKKILLGLTITLLVFTVAVFWLLYFSSRPPLTIDPVTLAGDGSLLNYCELPILQGRNKMAADIPKGNTPGCGYTHFPLPVLAACTEPLAKGAADIRGLWLGVEGKVGHLERIEQCGARTVITTSGIIHDYGPNSSAQLNTDDTEGAVLFTLGGKEYCPRTSASLIWKDEVLNFHAFGWGPNVVQRYLEDGQLVWRYVDGSITRMQRICTLPDEHKVPLPRGSRYKVW